MVKRSKKKHSFMEAESKIFGLGPTNDPKIFPPTRNTDFDTAGDVRAISVIFTSYVKWNINDQYVINPRIFFAKLFLKTG